MKASRNFLIGRRLFSSTVKFFVKHCSGRFPSQNSHLKGGGTHLVGLPLSIDSCSFDLSRSMQAFIILSISSRLWIGITWWLYPSWWHPILHHVGSLHFWGTDVRLCSAQFHPKIWQRGERSSQTEKSIEGVARGISGHKSAKSDFFSKTFSSFKSAAIQESFGSMRSNIRRVVNLTRVVVTSNNYGLLLSISHVQIGVDSCSR